MASMTYLQIAQLAHRTIRMGNQSGGTQPTAIPAPAGSDQVVLDIVDTIPRAYERIQNEHPSWNWMRKQVSIILTAGTRVYSLSAIQAKQSDWYGLVPFWASNYPWPYILIYDSGLPAANQVDYPYPFVEYIDWRGFWDRLPRPANTQPNRVTEQPNKALEFDPAPALAPSGGQWGFRSDYRVINQVLALQSDVPAMPAEFHEMIAYLTVMLVAEMRGTQGPGVAYAMSNYQIMMDRLKARYLPQMQIDMSYAF